jgi:hypothetical protein
MSDMPKEIWAWEAPELDDYETAWSIHQPHPSYDCKKSKYVRGDIVEAMKAQLEAMADALDTVIKWTSDETAKSVAEANLAAYNEFMKGVK